MHTLTVLVGLPGSGKSTSISEDFDGFVYSTDNYIEKCAKMNGLSYNESFQEFIKPATKSMNEQLEIAVRQKADVLWDQTNMSSKKRIGILSKFPKSYRKICICRVPPQTGDEWLELGIRLGARPGKIIPMHIIETMADSYVKPTIDEGFEHLTRWFASR